MLHSLSGATIDPKYQVSCEPLTATPAVLSPWKRCPPATDLGHRSSFQPHPMSLRQRAQGSRRHVNRTAASSVHQWCRCRNKTHLDTYKRQEASPPPLQPLDSLLACLIGSCRSPSLSDHFLAPPLPIITRGPPRDTKTLWGTERGPLCRPHTGHCTYGQSRS